ncbi:unnamed protein product [Periconia digitata]|uniref:Zn(2)-C6 fungal-type domain-containing protein n=1 Tax=Periconia digitata TaxID=1303443 RepID=A0A9W4UK82_9PLEO|nr:unnamed protein product [Periconia digitata]
MPPPPGTCSSTNLTPDSKIKKTKSRNGCTRCKIKRLKCDETAPGCLQCKKRNVACPGYEKTLKWSTKYEVFQPPQLAKPPSKALPTKMKDRKTPPDVDRHFQALAAVLPADTKAREQNQKPSSLPSLSLPDVLTSSEESSPEPSDLSPAGLQVLAEPLLFEDNASLDSITFDALNSGVGMSMSNWSFDDLDGFNVDPGPIDSIDLDCEELYGANDTTNDNTNANTLSSSPRLSRSLLLDFYRLPSPSPSATAVDDVESVLIQHYFNHVCVLFSSFDSALNPFRTAIGRVYQDTPSIYFAIQSMSAAHLANTFPNMAAVGLDMQQKACDALHQELASVSGGQANCTKTLLTIMLLGLTTSWHEVDNLGEDFLTTARSLIFPKLICNSDTEKQQRDIQFFEECLIYWEMLMGFMSKNSMTCAPTGLRSRGNARKAPAAKPDGKIVPHPWTGIAPTVHILFAEVARLVRRECALDKKNCVNDIRRRQENLLDASTLEEDLLAAEYPSVDELADLGDEQTSKQDFVTMAEAYRCAGLLELYRVFPSILRKRLGASWNSNVSFKFPSPRFETRYEETDVKSWLNSLAMRVLDLIDSISISSGTICTQQIVIVTAASQLQRFMSIDYFDPQTNHQSIPEYRNLAINRLQAHASRLPAKPIRKQIELLIDTWNRLDNPDMLMGDNGWQGLVI